MKVFAATHDYDYSWDEVSTANWRKYCPWNKESSHVIAVDTLSRRVDPRSGVLRTERLITCKQSAPKWLASFFGSTDTSHVYEVSYVTPPRAALAAPSSTSTTTNSMTAAPNLDLPNTPPSTATLPAPPAHPEPRLPSVTMISYNLTYADLISVRETVTYTPSPADPSSKTRFEQNARVTALCGGWAKVREKIEGFTVERFGQNAERGRMGFEAVLEMSRRAFGEERERERRGRREVRI